MTWISQPELAADTPCAQACQLVGQADQDRLQDLCVLTVHEHINELWHPSCDTELLKKNLKLRANAHCQPQHSSYFGPHSLPPEVKEYTHCMLQPLPLFWP